MTQFTDDYDPGFLNVQGFGQSVLNPLYPVYYQSLGIVKDLSVYGSSYVTNSLHAGVSVDVGKSRLSTSALQVGVPSNFDSSVDLKGPVKVKTLTDTKRLLVNGVEYKRQKIKCENGTFMALVAVGS